MIAQGSANRQRRDRTAESLFDVERRDDEHEFVNALCGQRLQIQKFHEVSPLIAEELAMNGKEAFGNGKGLDRAVIGGHDGDLARASPLGGGQSDSRLRSIERGAILIPSFQPAGAEKKRVARFKTDALLARDLFNFGGSDDVSSGKMRDTMMTGDIKQHAARDNRTDPINRILFGATRINRFLRFMAVVHNAIGADMAERVYMGRAVSVDHQQIFRAAESGTAEILMHGNVPVFVATRPDGRSRFQRNRERIRFAFFNESRSPARDFGRDIVERPSLVGVAPFSPIERFLCHDLDRSELGNGGQDQFPDACGKNPRNAVEWPRDDCVVPKETLRMKICFMGTPDFAIPTLERLVESRHEVCLVVTQPSKPKGRGQVLADPPVKTLADSRGIPVLQPKSLKTESIEGKIRELGVDVIVVVAYGKILPTSLLESPKIGCLNVHASLLPEYRGAAPIQRAMLEGRLETGVTIMKVAPELDAGPIVAQSKMDISDDDDALSVSNYLSVLGADLLLRVLDDVENEGLIEGVEQEHSEATYAAMLKKEEGQIPWNETSEQIMYRIRALTPWPGCFTTMDGKQMRIIQAEPLDADEAEHHGVVPKAPSGSVAGIMKGFGFIVKTGDGHLLITQLQPEGKPVMDAAAFLNGRALKLGQRLGN